MIWPSGRTSETPPLWTGPGCVPKAPWRPRAWPNRIDPVARWAASRRALSGQPPRVALDGERGFLAPPSRDHKSRPQGDHLWGLPLVGRTKESRSRGRRNSGRRVRALLGDGSLCQVLFTKKGQPKSRHHPWVPRGLHHCRPRELHGAVRLDVWGRRLGVPEGVPRGDSCLLIHRASGRIVGSDRVSVCYLSGMNE